MATPAHIAAQPTDVGRKISRLTMFDGKLYPSYGDYGANTGPVDVVALDLTTQTMGATEVTLHTEQIWSIRPLLDGGRIVAYLDPQGGSGNPENGQYATHTDGAWTVHANVTPYSTHVFDACETVDGLWLFGSDEATDDAVIWRSTDDGATWAAALTVPPEDGAIADFNRFYSCAVFGDDVLAFRDDLLPSTHAPLVYRWASGGTDWTPVESGLPQIGDTPAAFTYQGTPFWVGLKFGKPNGQVIQSPVEIITLPGVDPAPIAASLPAGTSGTASLQLLDAYATTTHLWLLTDNRRVWRGDDQGVWVNVIDLTDSTLQCLAVDEDAGWIYFGTADSRILRTPIPT